MRILQELNLLLIAIKQKLKNKRYFLCLILLLNLFLRYENDILQRMRDALIVNFFYQGTIL